ncbi:hypothetical protein DRE_01074 [Drechslerella stenobrocha 248]|uniref:Uncharacterized protein n=1 Tax=Drechslerella stenobrocha 248 TaxID=1043628 RepID=W7HWF5_9PEZI|nr:hypothetical protein DRE_01074 [Drechslerella stenobrocha 248]
MLTLLSITLFLPLAALAQNSLCDKYTTAIFPDNTGSNQYSFIIRLVNTALIGNYIAPSNVAINGVLLPGTYMGEEVTLLPYFNGGLISSNRGEAPGTPTAINFLDDGGVAALSQGKPSYGQTSNQYKVFSHMYQFFGGLLGCSRYGQDGFASYQGNSKMYEAHKFMNLKPLQLGYFIQQVLLSTEALGFEPGDTQAFGSQLNNTFGRRCSPRQAVLPDTKPDLQAMCVDISCPLAEEPICRAYNNFGGFGLNPMTATSTRGPQVTDITPHLNSAHGDIYVASTFTTFDIQITTTIEGSTITIATFVAFPVIPPPVSFTTEVVSIPTTIDGSATFLTSQVVSPIGGGLMSTSTDIVTTNGTTITREYTFTVPSSVIKIITTVVTTSGSTITTRVPATVGNPALVIESGVETTLTSIFTSDGVVVTQVITTVVPVSATNATDTSTTGSPNGAPLQTAGPLLMLAIGAGLAGHML